MIDRSGDAYIGNGVSIEGVPVAVPDHETLQRVVVGGQPGLELVDGVRGGIVAWSSCRSRGDDSDQQLIASHSAEVW